jgi:predicted nucleic acid-binding protein
MLVDTSAWVEYLRETGSATHTRVRTILDLSEAAITDVVAMEILAGARDAAHLRGLEEFLEGLPYLPVDGLDDFEYAAEVYRLCRVRGKTIRNLADCLIAAVAIRNDVPVLHNDGDFDVLARHTSLQIA